MDALSKPSPAMLFGPIFLMRSCFGLVGFGKPATVGVGSIDCKM